jgi:hypothetical protein
MGIVSMGIVSAQFPAGSEVAVSDKVRFRMTARQAGQDRANFSLVLICIPSNAIPTGSCRKSIDDASLNNSPCRFLTRLVASLSSASSLALKETVRCS